MPAGQQQLELVPLTVSPYELGLLADARDTLETVHLFALDVLQKLDIEQTPLTRQIALLSRLAGDSRRRCRVPR